MSLFSFFFKPEDGIRDRNVTGVQTCALPISFLFIGFINGLMNPYDEEEHKAEAEQQEAEEKAEAEQKAEEEKKQVEKEKKEESKPKTIELDDFAMAEFSIEDKIGRAHV